MSKSATDSVLLIKPGQIYVGKQGFDYKAGASTETVGAKRGLLERSCPCRPAQSKSPSSQGY
jgi:uncharacterized RmlC-like cupin family protein